MRRPTTTGQRSGAAAIAAMTIALAIVLPRLVLGPSEVHVGPILASGITVCDRHYNGAGLTRSLADVSSNGPTPVLVDPGLFGLFPSCPAPNLDGNRPCSRDPSASPCATVVYVRVGVDAYAAYDLAGGP